MIPLDVSMTRQSRVGLRESSMFIARKHGIIVIDEDGRVVSLEKPSGEILFKPEYKD